MKKIKQKLLGIYAFFFYFYCRIRVNIFVHEVYNFSNGTSCSMKVQVNAFNIFRTLVGIRYIPGVEENTKISLEDRIIKTAETYALESTLPLVRNIIGESLPPKGLVIYTHYDGKRIPSVLKRKQRD